jgi:hypothetical protein
MKKTITLSAFLIILAIPAFSQSITLNELHYLLGNVNKHKFLTSKYFKVVQQPYTGLPKPPVTYYTKSNNTTAAETVIIGLGIINKNHLFVPDISYTTTDTTYINTFIKQIYRSGFKLTVKKTDKKKYSFLFKKDALHITVNKRKDGGQSQVYLHQSF